MGFEQYLDSAQEGLLNAMFMLHTFATQTYRPVSYPAHFPVEDIGIYLSKR